MYLSCLGLVSCSFTVSWDYLCASCSVVSDSTVGLQVPLSMEFSKQEYWCELPFPSPGESSLPKDRTHVSHIAGRFFSIWATGDDSGLTIGISYSLISARWQILFVSFLNSLRAHLLTIGSCGWNLWWLWHPLFADIAGNIPFLIVNMILFSVLHLFLFFSPRSLVFLWEWPLCTIDNVGGNVTFRFLFSH